MKKSKSFDCVEMMHEGAWLLNEKLAGMTEEEQLEYWKRRREELLAKRAMAGKKRDGEAN